MGVAALNLIRFVPRAIAIVVWVLGGLMTIALCFWWVGLRGRLWLKQQWSRVLLRLCGLSLQVQGEPELKGPVLWAVNHVSWLDIFVLNVVRSTTFVAKQEIRHWPLLGWLAAGADTIFIERGFRHAVQRVGHAMQDRFEKGQVVGLFPEGTTSEGFDVLSFYGNLFEPGRRLEVTVQPVALTYFYLGQRSALAAFVGEESLLINLWRVLGARGVSVGLTFLPPVAVAGQEKPPRAVLATQTREAIRAVVTRGLPTV